MKRVVAFLLCAVLLTSPAWGIETKSDADIDIAVPSAVLMEKTTGEVIYEKNAHDRLEPASVTKVMTLLLVVEAIDAGTLKLDDIVTASTRASSMGGSQIWLKEGEQMTVSEMLKCVTVVSANDCAVALAEHIAGTEAAFVQRMNERAKELGMEDTNFTNCTGLMDDPEHLTSAYDIAVMSRELIQHDLIKDYTTIWMDTVREGRFTLANTNKLIYYYDGATGLKTGFTSKAMYCLSATAEKDGIEYIAVVMHGATSPERFDSAKTLLNYAFANYTLANPTEGVELPQVQVNLGSCEFIQPVCAGEASLLMEKNAAGDIRCEIELPESVDAPVLQGQQLGCLRVYSGDTQVNELPLIASVEVGRVRTGDIYLSLLYRLMGGI